jgi:MoaA/NifB/PqqE/SkfB family radical SAM enzyme
MNTISYSDFSAKVHSASSKKRIPLDVGLDLTYRCNNKCVHCYCNLPADDKKALQEELKTDEVKNLLDELASMGSLWLLITGGEPLLRPDFEEIYLHAKKKGFLITLFTNGTLIDDKTIKFLSGYPPFVVEITLYGATKETYEKVTRVKGSYEKCINGIEGILSSGIKLKLKSMAITINKHEIEAMDRMAQEYGCAFRFDPIIQKRTDSNNYSEPVKYRIKPEDVVRLDMAFPKRMKEWYKFCVTYLGKQMKCNRLYWCGAGIANIHVNPYGECSGCIMMREVFSVRDHNVRWIWNEGINTIINQEKGFALPCDECNFINLCDQCPPWSMIENNDIMKTVEYLCDIAKIRAEYFNVSGYQKEAKGYGEKEMDNAGL